MVRRGLGEDALRLLAALPHPKDNPELIIQELTLESSALTIQQNFPTASQRLSEAEALCKGARYLACGGVLRTRGILEARLGNLAEAQQRFLDSLAFARTNHDRRLEASALANLGWASLQIEHYDEAIGWFRSAYDVAAELGAEDFAQIASGDLGWAYFKLGDKEQALELFLTAEKRAANLGNIQAEITWKSNVGYLYQDAGNLDRAVQAYLQSLNLANQIKSKEDIVNALEDLAHASIDAGKLDEANSYIDRVDPLISAANNHLDALDVMLAQAEISAARHQDLQAETVFRSVERDPASQISMRMGAEHELAKLFEREGKTDLAARMRLRLQHLNLHEPT